MTTTDQGVPVPTPPPQLPPRVPSRQLFAVHLHLVRRPGFCCCCLCLKGEDRRRLDRVLRIARAYGKAARRG